MLWEILAQINNNAQTSLVIPKVFSIKLFSNISHICTPACNNYNEQNAIYRYVL